ncbi:MAG: undecaprenyldiphospho-muramoylpentapeptide beta-N-acetylglucosaminyltransferase [Halioglobus sp.]|nr:undecaprenyldiphospho-muramoylpentapeptide beta-N-acetylglucosaminyltransferase [Halioglobus sp.]
MILMLAGGTGGHVYPALAVANELLSRGYRVEWVGSDRGLEQRIVPAAGIRLHRLPVRGVRGKSLAHKVLGLICLLRSAAAALWLVFRRGPGCVVGMGGYVSGPAGVAAWLLRKPLIIHEQNAVAGTANRLLAPFARRVLGGFPGAFAENVPVTLVGNPVRRELLQAREQCNYDFAGQRPLRLLVVGGSLGAAPINAVLPGVIHRLILERPSSVEVRHQTGEGHAAVVERDYAELLQECVSVTPFIDDMATAYSWADLVLCRCGALTIAELCVVGRPAILVPLPHAIDDHQTANARALTDQGGATLLPQSQLDEDSVLGLLREFLSSSERLAAMAAAAFDAASPEAAVRVGDCCEELLYA